MRRSEAVIVMSQPNPTQHTPAFVRLRSCACQGLSFGVGHQMCVRGGSANHANRGGVLLFGRHVVCF